MAFRDVRIGEVNVAEDLACLSAVDEGGVSDQRVELDAGIAPEQFVDRSFRQNRRATPHALRERFLTHRPRTTCRSKCLTTNVSPR